MRNGYFELTNTPGGFGLRVFPPKEDGVAVRLEDVLAYLELVRIPCDPVEVRKAMAMLEQNNVIFLGLTECPAVTEQYHLKVSDDAMEAVVRFYPPSSTGKRMDIREFLNDLNSRNIIFGIKTEEIQKHFQSDGVYCTDMVVAVGKPARHGSDAKIVYHFNTDLHVQPTVREDGSVDFFNLNMINHCQKGDLLAEIIPEDVGEYGTTINGNNIKPRDVKRATLKFANNIELSEDRLTIRSKVNGHVMLVDDKVFVSDVYEVENVDMSTGNVDFDGSVQINGNVASNFVVKAGGNVIINGVVEGAHVVAGGNIIIARGMNGMSKGTLEAGGDIIAKFIENSTVTAGGYVHTEAILHSRVIAGTEIVVDGRKGFITGGHVQAYNRIEVKTLGATLGTSTVVEVGVNPQIKSEYIELQKDMGEVVKDIKAIQPIIANFLEKKAKGARFSSEQIKFIQGQAQTLEGKKKELAEKNNRMLTLQGLIDNQRKAEVVVKGVVYGGTTIVIGDVSTVLQSSYKYCKFERISGEVKSVPL